MRHELPFPVTPPLNSSALPRILGNRRTDRQPRCYCDGAMETVHMARSNSPIGRFRVATTEIGLVVERLATLGEMIDGTQRLLKVHHWPQKKLIILKEFAPALDKHSMAWTLQAGRGKPPFQRITESEYPFSQFPFHLTPI